MQPEANTWGSNMLKTYRNIWFCGLAGSGKTTILNLLHNTIKNVEYLNDSFEIVEFVKNDVHQEHHRKPNPNSFVLTDSAATYYSVKQLISKVKASNKTTIIEMSRGVDKENIVDFSYRYLFSQLDESLLQNSLFIYIHTPFANRVERNNLRPLLSGKIDVFTSFRCPDEAMNRFFTNDDFFDALKKTPVNSLIILNNMPLEILKKRIVELFAM